MVALGRVSIPDSKDSYLIYSFLSVLQQDLQNFLHKNKPTTNTITTTKAIFISPPFSNYTTPISKWLPKLLLYFGESFSLFLLPIK